MISALKLYPIIYTWFGGTRETGQTVGSKPKIIQIFVKVRRKIINKFNLYESIAVSIDGFAFITSGLKYPPYSVPQAGGEVYIMDLTDPEPEAKLIKIMSPFQTLNMNPHGIKILERGDGRLLVYIINHGKKFDKVEKFQYK